MISKQPVKLGTVTLPEEFKPAHEFCFLLHDILVEALRSGEENEIFRGKIDFDDEEDQLAFGDATDIFDWLEKSGRLVDQGKVLSAIATPALLSDALLCIFDALKASERGRLSVAYMMLRKPIQESLFVFESMVLDETLFGELLANDPMKLRAEKAGGPDIQEVRVRGVLNAIRAKDFDPRYIADLRYNKSAEDSFAGVCNQAMHLFTEHKAIRTSNLNINFIFSSMEAKHTQWAYLYSRLPYLLAYFRAVVEHLLARLSLTDPRYLADLQRRIDQAKSLWAQSVSEEYRCEPLRQFAFG